MRKYAAIVFAVILVAALAWSQAQPSGQASPSFKPPARSASEATALGYMHTVIYAQREYKKKHGQYATSLAALVHSGSFTRRMVRTDRGDYKVSFQGDGKKYALRLTPIEIGPDRRAFYTNDTGVIRVDDSKAASPESPPLK
jgi:hypothetical protein